ncbi:MAG: class I SAM-dependent methyltransferase [Bacteroidia bacterium]
MNQERLKQLGSYFSEYQLSKLKSLYFNFYVPLMSKLFSSDLNKLAELNGSDKWGSHWYTQHYNAHFKHLRKKKLVILEIGVGGYEEPTAGGNSLRMWSNYFPNSNIYAIDIYDKSPHNSSRIKTFKGSQVDNDFLKSVLDEIGTPDIIIDDGSHINEHVIHSFKFLFPYLSENGIYAIEDTQTSYYPIFGGDSHNLNNPNSMMTLFKSLVDALNYEEIIKPGYVPSYLDKNITSIHFYHNLVFVNKGANNEGSNLIKNNDITEEYKICQEIYLNQ